jgi:hypothetical protein
VKTQPKQGGPAAEWFEMAEVRKRNPANAVWIPLRQNQTLKSEGTDNLPGRTEEYVGLGSVAIFPQYREIAAQLSWSDIGIGHDARPYAFSDGRYKPADVYMHNDEEVIGAELVLEERLNRSHSRDWIVSQDLVLALNLLREGDVWKAVDEGYIEVVRLHRGPDGEPVLVDIRAEHLRDYLAAHGLVLRASQYRQRMAILSDASYLPWALDGKQESKVDERFETRVFEVGDDGSAFGGKVAVFHMWRTDVEDQDEVPNFGLESASNTNGSTSEFERGGKKFFRAEGELWREFWVDPAALSERVRGDRNPEDTYFYTGAGGERSASSSLNSEDVGQYLWFRSSVVLAALGYRGSALSWYTRQTGSISCSPDYHVHFGVNDIGLITVYAYDVARLPSWQRRLWVGHNIQPEGGVSMELLDSQQRARPASTRAPERDFSELAAVLNSEFHIRYGGNLFRHHDAWAQILSRVHRFRVSDQASLLELAKDIARLTADSIDSGVLRSVIAPPKGEAWRSLRHLEKALATIVEPEVARTTLTPLAGVYDLRLADAHLPSQALSEAFQLVGINPQDPPINQAMQLLDGAIRSLAGVLRIVRSVGAAAKSVVA